MPNGIIIIDKPAGWTSMDVCAKLRGVFHEKRIGHAGTLDPMATGVLPVFVGRATRAVEFADKSDKEYLAGLKLGVITNTQDTSGEVLERRPVQAAQEGLEQALAQFRGDILQVPPMYSAIKINGKKLYELARKGREVERPARPVTIRALTLEGQTGEEEYALRVRCSKGTYVRTLCHDIGQALGCGGCMSALRRTMAAGFTLDDALPLEQVLEAPDPAGLLLPVDEYFARSGWTERLTVPPAAENRLRNGAAVRAPGKQGSFRAYSEQGEFLALVHCEDGVMKTVKSFFSIRN